LGDAFRLARAFRSGGRLLSASSAASSSRSDWKSLMRGKPPRGIEGSLCPVDVLLTPLRGRSDLPAAFLS
jgi:hypothetical protein